MGQRVFDQRGWARTINQVDNHDLIIQCFKFEWDIVIVTANRSGVHYNLITRGAKIRQRDVWQAKKLSSVVASFRATIYERYHRAGFNQCRGDGSPSSATADYCGALVPQVKTSLVTSQIHDFGVGRVGVPPSVVSHKYV